MVVVRTDHPLAGRKQLSWQDLDNERIILRDEGSGSRLAVDEFLAAHDYSITRPLALASSEAIKLSVMANMGVGVLSAYALVNAEADGLKQLRVKGFPLTTQWHVIHLREKSLSRVARSFLDFMLGEGRDYLPMDSIEERLRQARAR